MPIQDCLNFTKMDRKVIKQMLAHFYVHGSDHTYAAVVLVFFSFCFLSRLFCIAATLKAQRSYFAVGVFFCNSNYLNCIGVVFFIMQNLKCIGAQSFLKKLFTTRRRVLVERIPWINNFL